MHWICFLPGRTARQIVKQYIQSFSARHMWSVNPRGYIPVLSGRWMLLVSLPLGNTVCACLMLIPILSLCLCSQGRLQNIPYCSVHCCICHLGLSTTSLNGKCSTYMSSALKAFVPNIKWLTTQVFFTTPRDSYCRKIPQMSQINTKRGALPLPIV